MRLLAAALHAAVLAAPLVAGAQGSTVYRCPGNVYTSEISEREAKERNCRTIEGAPITIVNTAKPAPQARGKDGEGRAASAPRGADSRVDPTAQRQRDSDARKILEAELKREEEALAALLKEFNNGEPERQGNERNFARYQERVEELRSAIARKQADISAIRRELAKLPAPKAE